MRSSCLHVAQVGRAVWADDPEAYAPPAQRNGGRWTSFNGDNRPRSVDEAKMRKCPDIAERLEYVEHIAIPLAVEVLAPISVRFNEQPAAFRPDVLASMRAAVLCNGGFNRLVRRRALLRRRRRPAA
jgi:hypothetical protein